MARTPRRASTPGRPAALAGGRGGRGIGRSSPRAAAAGDKRTDGLAPGEGLPASEVLVGVRLRVGGRFARRVAAKDHAAPRDGWRRECHARSCRPGSGEGVADGAAWPAPRCASTTPWTRRSRPRSRSLATRGTSCSRSLAMRLPRRASAPRRARLTRRHLRRDGDRQGEDLDGRRARRGWRRRRRRGVSEEAWERRELRQASDRRDVRQPSSRVDGCS